MEGSVKKVPEKWNAKCLECGRKKFEPIHNPASSIFRCVSCGALIKFPNSQKEGKNE
jgi:ribosomal protein S27E